MQSKKWTAGLLVSALAAAALVPVAVAAQNMPGRGMGPADRPTFSDLDTDGDGNVTIAEFRARQTSRFAEADTDGNGVLTVEEMSAAAAARAAEQAAKMFEQMVQWRDTDGDGALSIAELGNDNGQRMFMMLDANHDGMISAEEFEKAEEMRGAGGRFGRDGARGPRGFGEHGGRRGG